MTIISAPLNLVSGNGEHVHPSRFPLTFLRLSVELLAQIFAFHILTGCLNTIDELSRRSTQMRNLSYLHLCDEALNCERTWDMLQHFGGTLLYLSRERDLPLLPITINHVLKSENPLSRRAGME